MAENLKSKDDENEQKDKLEQMDTKLKYIKDLIIEEAMRWYGIASSEEDPQKVIFLLALSHINFIRINKFNNYNYNTITWYK